MLIIILFIFLSGTIFCITLENTIFLYLLCYIYIHINIYIELAGKASPINNYYQL